MSLSRKKKYLLSDFLNYHLEILKDGYFENPRLLLGNEVESNSLAFVLNEEYFLQAYNNDNVSCIICSEEVKNFLPDSIKKGIALSSNPRFSFYSIHNSLVREKTNGEFTDSTIADGTYIHPSAIVSDYNVTIGKGCRIEENVIIREGVTIGDETVIRAGAIIGIDNDLNCYDFDNNLSPIMPGGNVVIGENCEIGYYTTIARGMMIGESTVINDHVFLGAKVTIGHNVVIGRNSDIIDNSQICGYTVLGDDCHVSPQSIISNKLKIGDNVFVTIGSTVVNSLKNDSAVAGNFAIDKDKFLRWHLKKIRNKE